MTPRKKAASKAQPPETPPTPPETAVVPADAATDYAVGFVTTPEMIGARVDELQAFVKAYMVEDEDYGTIPGTRKPTLYKPGAEKLCDVYGFQRLVEVTHRVEDWDAGLFAYEVVARLVSMRTGLVVAEGLGACNSKEEHYRWRTKKPACQQCGKELRRGDREWYCWRKQGGCGATVATDTAEGMALKVERIENDEPFTLVNTILKMAKKRALVDAVLSATRSSGVFSQDIEDMEPVYEPPPQPATQGAPTEQSEPAEGSAPKESSKPLSASAPTTTSKPAPAQPEGTTDEEPTAASAPPQDEPAPPGGTKSDEPPEPVGTSGETRLAKAARMRFYGEAKTRGYDSQEGIHKAMKLECNGKHGLARGQPDACTALRAAIDEFAAEEGHNEAGAWNLLTDSLPYR